MQDCKKKKKKTLDGDSVGLSLCCDAMIMMVSEGLFGERVGRFAVLRVAE